MSKLANSARTAFSVRWIKLIKVIFKYGTEQRVCGGKCDDCVLHFKCFTEREATLSEEEWLKVDPTKETGKTLEEWEETILREIPFVDVKPYSHNIITVALSAIARGWGNKRANDTVDKFGLVTLGYKKEVVHRKK
jgi:hypothetical protein